MPLARRPAPEVFYGEGNVPVGRFRRRIPRSNYIEVYALKDQNVQTAQYDERFCSTRAKNGELVPFRRR